MTERFTMSYLNAAANQIDAAMFSGDDFLNAGNRERLRFYLARWERGLASAEESATEDDNDPTEEDAEAIDELMALAMIAAEPDFKMTGEHENLLEWLGKGETCTYRDCHCGEVDDLIAGGFLDMEDDELEGDRNWANIRLTDKGRAHLSAMAERTDGSPSL